MAEPVVESASVAETKKQIQNFLNDEANKKYAGKLQEMRDNFSIQRFIININDLYESNRGLYRDLADNTVRNPVTMIPVFEAAVKELMMDVDPNYFTRLATSSKIFTGPTGDKASRIPVGFEGHFSDRQVTPRTLVARHLSSMVALHGIVTRVSLVRPKVLRSVHYCPATSEFTSKEYRDATDLTGAPTGSVYPTKDKDGNSLETEYGMSQYKDSQTVTIQEMPESAPLGQLPRSVDVSLEGDLVDRVKPGDRVAMYGIYRAMVGVSATTAGNGNFRTMLLANNARSLGKDSTTMVLTESDTENIKDFAKSKDHFETLAKSLAPSIYGHANIKRSLALLLAGGSEHNLQNGTHIRGDINLLMVGDPSTAKSQLLRFVLNIAQVAVNTTGRGSSGVGLTAAVTTDPETGERRLEAGAMVLADRGVVCIDEFDKMSDADRVAIHEVMEQQTVTIAKAGIQASLNARCSVVAAANPVYGRFDPDLPTAKNVALPDSLLSRFDMLFIVRDIQDKTSDLRIAEHVVRMHRYQRPGHEGVPVRLDATMSSEHQYDEASEAKDGTSPVYIKYNPMLHGGMAAEAQAEAGDNVTAEAMRLLSLDFIRKYIFYAKANHKPKLSENARSMIVAKYNYFRSTASTNGNDRRVIVTARSLETLIRLSTAHAKLRLKNKVGVKDVEKAYKLLHFSMYGSEADDDAERDEPQRPVNGSGRPGDDGNDEQGIARTPFKAPRADGESEARDDFEFPDDEDDDAPRPGSKRRGVAQSTVVKRSRKSAQALEERLAEEDESEMIGKVELEHQDASMASVPLSFLAGEEDGSDDIGESYSAFSGPSADVNSEEYKSVLRAVASFYKADKDAAGSLGGDLAEHLKARLPSSVAAKVDNRAWLFGQFKAMEQANKVMVDMGIVSLV